MHSSRVEKNFIVTLAIGILIGFLFGCALLTTNTKSFRIRNSLYKPISDVLLLDNHGHGHEHGNVHSHANIEDDAGPKEEVPEHSLDEEMHKGADVEAQQLAGEVKVLCWIMTTPKNHQKKAIHVKRTWGKRCTKLLFMSSEVDSTLPSVALPNVKDGRGYLWAKTREAFRYVYNNHFDDADWFMKADDDTYVLVENLRYMLKDIDPSDPVYFGSKFKLHVKQGYMSGGAGYVLSKEALLRFVRDMDDIQKCRLDHKGDEDVEMGKCMENSGVKAGDSRDNLGRNRFFPLTPELHVTPRRSAWYWTYIYYPQKPGLDCCSDTAISFHYISPTWMYSMEYFVYHLRPYGISSHYHAFDQIEYSSPHPDLNGSSDIISTNNSVKKV